MENTTIAPTFLVTVEFSWHYPGKPVNTVVKDGYIQTSAEDIGQAFIDTFIENYHIGVCKTSDIEVKSIERIFTYEEWVEKFKPITNEISGTNTYDGYAFDYCNARCTNDCVGCKEWNFILNQNPKCIWTLCDVGDSSFIRPGLGIVDRLFYFVASIPFSPEDLKTVYHVIE